MSAHAFIFIPGTFNGQGKVSFSSSPDVIRFYTQWVVQEREGDVIRAIQKVEMQGSQETLVNSFQFSAITAESFDIELTNELLGTVHGKGIINSTQFGWEFHGYPTFDGFEVYSIDDKDDFHVHAEYASPDNYRTIIDGRLWRKT